MCVGWHATNRRNWGVHLFESLLAIGVVKIELLQLSCSGSSPVTLGQSTCSGDERQLPYLNTRVASHQPAPGHTFKHIKPPCTTKYIPYSILVNLGLPHKGLISRSLTRIQTKCLRLVEVATQGGEYQQVLYHQTQSSSLPHRGPAVSWQQLRQTVSLHPQRWSSACTMDHWREGDLSLAASPYFVFSREDKVGASS